MSAILKVMSVNLRYDKPDPDNCAWSVRRYAIADAIAHYQPDLVGTQEGKAHQLLDLHRSLGDYQSVGRDRSGTGTDEHCAIFYRTQHLTRLSSGDFYLSDTPEVAGSIGFDWGNPLPRMATWGVFATPQGQQIALVNTHLDYHSERSRDLSAELIRDRLVELAPLAVMRFLTADFNAPPKSHCRQRFAQPLSNGIQLCDALVAQHPIAPHTAHDFTGKTFASIDTIYGDRRVRLQWVKVDTQRWEGVFPSDHFPVIAQFEIH